MSKLQRIIFGLLALILLVTAVEAIRSKPVREEPEEMIPEVACVGEPIVLSVPYTGTVVDEWSCQPQCEDDKPRYLLYTNGKATQCGTPPNCYDTGEDNGVTCMPPVAATPAE